MGTNDFAQRNYLERCDPITSRSADYAGASRTIGPMRRNSVRTTTDDSSDRAKVHHAEHYQI